MGDVGRQEFGGSRFCGSRRFGNSWPGGVHDFSDFIFCDFVDRSIFDCPLFSGFWLCCFLGFSGVAVLSVSGCLRFSVFCLLSLPGFLGFLVFWVASVLGFVGDG